MIGSQVRLGILGLALLLVLTTAQAAEPGAGEPGAGEPGAGGPGGGGRAAALRERFGGGAGMGQAATPASILEKYDADKDGELSKEEFQKFADEEFAKADRSGNSKLDMGELTRLLAGLAPRPAMGPGGPGGPGGQGGFPTFKNLDKNGDGKLAKDEVPGFLQQRFDQIDANGDGLIDESEWNTVRERMTQRMGGGAGGRGAGAGQAPGAGGGRKAGGAGAQEQGEGAEE